MRTLLRHKKPSTVLGIDITPNAVYLLALAHRPAQYGVESYAKIPMPHHAIKAGRILDLDAVVQAVQRAVVASNTKSKHVVLAVPNAFTLIKTIQISARLNQRDLHAWVRLEMEEHMSSSQDDIYFDYHIVGPSDQNAAVLDVLIVASRAEHVNQRVEVIRQAGLSAHIVEVESYAFERAALQLTGEHGLFESSKTLFMIDISFTATRFMVLDGRKIIFSREEALDGQAIGARHDAAYDGFFTQLNRAWLFFSSTQRSHTPNQIVLTGSVSHLSHLARLIQSELNISTHVGNPLGQMTVSSAVYREQIEQDASCLMVACGLALRGLGVQL